MDLKVLMLIVLGFIFMKIVDSIHAKIGTYEGITDRKCGYNCKTSQFNKCNDCKKGKRAQLSQKLMGADNALIGEFPWMVSFQSNNSKRHFCSGTLLNSIWIITAAHCFTRNRKVDTFYIRTGSHKINKGNIERAHKYYIHPKYNFSDVTGPFDLALVLIDRKADKLILKKKFIANPINGICLPEKDIKNESQERAYYSGFGRIHYKGIRAKNLMKSEMTLLPDNKCYSFISKYNMACVNSTATQTCKGDSGSPLVQYVNNRAVLIGIHKGSIRNRGKCGRETAVTTRISKFIDWICDTIRNHSNNINQ